MHVQHSLYWLEFCLCSEFSHLLQRAYGKPLVSIGIHLVKPARKEAAHSRKVACRGRHETQHTLEVSELVISKNQLIAT
jgi:hypothetical protein